MDSGRQGEVLGVPGRERCGQGEALKGQRKLPPLLPLGSEYFSTGTVPRLVELC